MCVSQNNLPNKKTPFLFNYPSLDAFMSICHAIRTMPTTLKRRRCNEIEKREKKTKRTQNGELHADATVLHRHRTAINLFALLLVKLALRAPSQSHPLSLFFSSKLIYIRRDIRVGFVRKSFAFVHGEKSNKSANKII